jgi:hypothetical protein
VKYRTHDLYPLTVVEQETSGYKQLHNKLWVPNSFVPYTHTFGSPPWPYPAFPGGLYMTVDEARRAEGLPELGVVVEDTPSERVTTGLSGGFVPATCFDWTSTAELWRNLFFPLRQHAHPHLRATITDSDHVASDALFNYWDPTWNDARVPPPPRCSSSYVWPWTGESYTLDTYTLDTTEGQDEDEEGFTDWDGFTGETSVYTYHQTCLCPCHDDGYPGPTCKHCWDYVRDGVTTCARFT